MGDGGVTLGADGSLDRYQAQNLIHQRDDCLRRIELHAAEIESHRASHAAAMMIKDRKHQEMEREYEAVLKEQMEMTMGQLAAAQVQHDQKLATHTEALKQQVMVAITDLTRQRDEARARVADLEKQVATLTIKVANMEAHPDVKAARREAMERKVKELQAALEADK